MSESSVEIRLGVIQFMGLLGVVGGGAGIVGEALSWARRRPSMRALRMLSPQPSCSSLRSDGEGGVRRLPEARRLPGRQRSANTGDQELSNRNLRSVLTSFDIRVEPICQSVGMRPAACIVHAQRISGSPRAVDRCVAGRRHDFRTPLATPSVSPGFRRPLTCAANSDGIRHTKLRVHTRRQRGLHRQ